MDVLLILANRIILHSFTTKPRIKKIEDAKNAKDDTNSHLRHNMERIEGAFANVSWIWESKNK
jgi:hypothetical protein